MTFSIVGFDPLAKEWGVAVQSKLLAVGAVVPWVKAGVGAVATQSFIHPSYGEDALHWLAQGKSAEKTLQMIQKTDPQRELRQVGIIDKHGQATTFTGKGCLPWSGGIVGENFSIQGNRLVDEQTIYAMKNHFTEVKGTLAERLLAALTAGQRAGGDREGQQASALLVVNSQRTIDLRVDDHPNPLGELQRLYQLHQLSFSPAKKNRIVSLVGDVKQELIEQLCRLGMLQETNVDEYHLNSVLTTFLHKKIFMLGCKKRV